MPRPKKDPDLVKGETLRIPVSAAEKARILETAVATDGEFARWARDILLREADEYHAQKSQRGRKPSARTNEAQKKEKILASALE
jgi:hypothetical protein